MVETLDIFNKFKTILCMCPNCSSLLRLSELHLRSKTPSPTTWLDEYDVKKTEVDEESYVVSQKEQDQQEILTENEIRQLSVDGKKLSKLF